MTKSLSSDTVQVLAEAAGVPLPDDRPAAIAAAVAPVAAAFGEASLGIAFEVEPASVFTVLKPAGRR